MAGNGLTESRTFSQYGELDAWTVSVGGNTTASYALTRDAAGNIASRTETVAPWRALPAPALSPFSPR